MADVVEFTVDGEKRIGFVPVWAGDAAAEISEVFDEPTDVRGRSLVRPFSLPKPDKVDDEIGDVAKRAAGFDLAMGMLTTRVLEGVISYDDKRSGAVWQGRAQVPHLVLAIEQFQKAVKDLDVPADPLAAVDEDHLILEGITSWPCCPNGSTITVRSTRTPGSSIAHHASYCASVPKPNRRLSGETVSTLGTCLRLLF